MAYDWTNITTLAYQTLLELGIDRFPIPFKGIKCKGVQICSYQEYSRKTGASVQSISCGNEFEDAFLIRNIRPGINLILYNEDKYPARLKHTLWHEIGHVKCKHTKHSEIEEIEAHYFAAQANAPNIIIRKLVQRGYQINNSFLMACFGLSQESAAKKLKYLEKYAFDHTNEYDDIVWMQFEGYINEKYTPRHSQIFSDDYYEEMEKERQNWHY